jgi:hypothetical protein
MAQPVADGLTFLLTVILFTFVYREIKELEGEAGIRNPNLEYNKESA